MSEHTFTGTVLTTEAVTEYISHLPHHVVLLDTDHGMKRLAASTDLEPLASQVQQLRQDERVRVTFEDGVPTHIERIWAPGGLNY